MREPKWLTLEMILAIHDEALAATGGFPGVRDTGLLDSGANRARQLFHYGKNPTHFDLAAACCAGIAKNHPFVDGNKRTALLAARAFLFLNGWLLEPREAEEVEMMVLLATGRCDEATFARWLGENSSRRRK